MRQMPYVGLAKGLVKWCMCVSNCIMFNTDVVFVKTSSDITLPYRLLVFLWVYSTCAPCPMSAPGVIHP